MYLPSFPSKPICNFVYSYILTNTSVYIFQMKHEKSVVVAADEPNVHVDKYKAWAKSSPWFCTDISKYIEGVVQD